MGKILFASNNPTHFGPLAYTDTSYVRDSSRIPYSIRFDADISTPLGVIKPTTTGEVWIHFRADTVNNAPSGDPSGDVIRIYDDQMRLLLKGSTGINTFFTDFTFYDTNGSTSTQNDVLDYSIGTGAWDIRFVFDPFFMQCQIYQGTVLRFDRTLNANPNNVGQVGRVDWLTKFHYAGSGFISELIIADSDTRLARLNMVRPNGNGFHTDWLGQVSTLADNNINTGLTTNSVNQRHSVTLEPYTNTEIISNVLITSQHFRGANSPGTIRHFIRATNIDYDHVDAFTVAFNNTVSQTDYEINPATALPWDLADIGSLEFGFKSEA
ncbi:hypothetical protein [Roseovarius sp. 217 phage 1]|uniref:Uncharacterized protein n=1 Tax=Roseovarius sp. 217 phage 1 TaxID=874471 RepID=E3PZC5_9CAUD|nr:hypothetical protein [Roseovarius sp. 217 phage 1]